jgi:hypothetical protein
MPDGTHVAILLDRDAVWNAGALVLIDRNLGPELSTREEATTSLPGFLHPVSFLGPYGAHGDEGNVRRESSNGAWRDPAPLPDGRVVASWAAGPTSLRGGPAPEFALYTLTFTRDRPDHDAAIATRELLVDLPGVSETEPVPVFRNVSIRPVAVAPRGLNGRLDHGGVPMLENILGRVGASGPRVVREDLRSVRVLEWIEMTSDPFVPTIMPSLYREQRQTGASPHMPARVLAEIPLESDGTFVADLPAGTAFRLQWLDRDGMAAGVQHNRWFDIAGGQTLHQGLAPDAFDRACTHCHGSRSGTPSDSFVSVDVTARASLSLARMELDDPDRPRTPPLLGLATRLPAEWRTVVAPALARSCTASSCHSGTTPAAGLSLEPRPTGRYDVAYESLVARGNGSANGFRYVDVLGATARGSFLVERLLGRELDAPRAVEITTSHRGEPPLDDDELRSIARWIESGALFCTEHCR